MPPLLVIPAMPRTGGTAREALPRLPALDELLRLSDAAESDANWRSGLLRDLGAAQTLFPEAVIAAGNCAIPPGSGVCLAAPVHAVAGLHRVHLHATGVLALAPDEQSALAEGFAAQFGDALRLHAAGSQWLLQTPCAVAAADGDPAEWAGAPLERRAATSAEQRALRRLGAEVEMWLADLPVNALRRSRGRLPVNMLWMWGGGETPAPALLPALPTVALHGPQGDAWLAGCARLAGATLQPLAAQWAPQDAPSAVVLPAPVDAGDLLAIGSAWLQPALDAVASRRIAALRLRIGPRLHHVRAGRLRRWLRRARPWWQTVGA